MATTHEDRLRELTAENALTDAERAACLAGAEALRLVREAIKGRCPWCHTVWTSQEFCCRQMQAARALLAFPLPEVPK